MGAVGAGFLFKSEDLSYQAAFLILGVLVLLFSMFTYGVTFSQADELEAAEEHENALTERARTQKAPKFKLPKPAIGQRAFTPLTVLRVYLGIGLMIKGIYYITNMSELESQLGSGFGETQNLIAWFVVGAHAVGGAALALGFVTRWVAAANAIVLAGASMIHLTGAGSDQLIVENQDFQFAALVLVTLIVFIWQGAGRFSLDRVMWGDDATPEGSGAAA